MKIGIIVHSKTGNTLSVAKRLMNALLFAGHEAVLEQVIASDDKQRDVRKIQLQDKPEVNNYDALVLGAPVWGFSLSTVMAAYLTQVGSLKGKKVVCFVTHAFPYPWLGGNRAVGQMKKLCEAAGAEVIETGVIDWSSRQRENKIARLIERVGGLF